MDPPPVAILWPWRSCATARAARSLWSFTRQPTHISLPNHPTSQATPGLSIYQVSPISVHFRMKHVPLALCGAQCSSQQVLQNLNRRVHAESHSGLEVQHGGVRRIGKVGGPSSVLCGVGQCSETLVLRLYVCLLITAACSSPLRVSISFSTVPFGSWYRASVGHRVQVGDHDGRDGEGRKESCSSWPSRWRVYPCHIAMQSLSIHTHKHTG